MKRDPAETATLYARWVNTGPKAATSKDVYVRESARYLAWLADQGPDFADALVDPHVRDYAAREYRRQMLQVHRKANATVAKAMSVVCNLYEWLEMGKPVNVGVDVGPGDRMGLPDEDLRRVLRAARRRGDRDFALVALLALSGVRLAEAYALDVDDVRTDERSGQVQVRYGKGGKPRTVPIGPQARAAVREWRAVRAGIAQEGERALFVSRTGGRLSARSIEEAVAAVATDAGVKMTPHTLRHTYGRRNFALGTDVATLQLLMGHKNPATTVVYGKPTAADLAAASERIEIDL